MGIPAVAQMSRYDKEAKNKYLAEAVKQFLQFADRMFIPEKGLYRHNALGPCTYYTYQEGILPSMSSVADSITAGNGKVIKTS